MWPRVAWPEARLAVSRKGSRNGTWQGRQGSHFGSSEASLGWIKIPPDPTHPEGRATWEGSSVKGDAGRFLTVWDNSRRPAAMQLMGPFLSTEARKATPFGRDVWGRELGQP